MDMTKVYIEGTGWLHHIAIIDLFDREIVGHHESLRARSQEWKAALDKALLNRFPDGSRGSGLILQVDNGCPPTSRSFQEHVNICGIKLSYIGIGMPEHNAFIERYFRSLKEEEIWPNIYETVEQTRNAIADYVKFYNTARVHSSLGYLTPRKFYRIYVNNSQLNVA